LLKDDLPSGKNDIARKQRTAPFELKEEAYMATTVTLCFQHLQLQLADPDAFALPNDPLDGSSRVGEIRGVHAVSLCRD
jgi:hypothetical protein